VDTYQSEDEQVAAIKKFIGDHGSKVLAVVILFIASVFPVLIAPEGPRLSLTKLVLILRFLEAKLLYNSKCPSV